MTALGRPGRSRAVAIAAIALAVTAVVAVAVARGALERLELSARDAALRLRPPALGPERIALVRIREVDIARFGHPLPDATLADAIARVLAAEPRAVGVDVYRDLPVGDGAERLAALFRNDPRLFVIEKLPEGSQPGIPAPGWIPRPEQVGFSDIVLDRDAVVRRGLLLLWDDAGTPHVALSLRLALAYLAADDVGLAASDSGEAIRLGDAQLFPFASGGSAYATADDGGYQILLDHRRGATSFASWALADLLAGRVPREALHDRVVLIGTSAPSVTDAFATPFSSPGSPVPAAPGFEMHAGLTDQILRHALDDAPPPRGLRTSAELGIVALGAALGATLGVLARSLLVVALGAAAAIAGWLGAAALALAHALWLPLVAPLGAVVASAGLGVAVALRNERHDRAALRELFSRHVSARVLDELWRQRDQFMEDGRIRAQRTVVTVLMLDLEGYTAASEKLDPAELMAWVNEFLSAMADLVERHGGVVDDYFGDGLKANFSVPLPRTREDEIRRDAAHAASCALAMGEAMDRLSQDWRRRGRPEGRVRIGLHTGAVVVGSVGGSARLKYTSVGDPVNVAARLEQEARRAPEEPGSHARVLLSGETARLLSEGFRVRPLGARTLSGREGAVEVFQLLSRDAGREETRE